MMAAVGGTAVAAALSGCSTLLSNNGSQDCGSGSVPDENIKAGLQTFTEGAAAVLGLQAQHGAELAVERINKAGGVGGRKMDLETVHEGDAHVENYKQFVDEGKEVTFGPISSGGHEAMAPEVESQQVVNVGTDGTVTTLYEETVTDPTYSFRFQNYDVMECVTAAREAVSRIGAENIDTIAGINPNYSFGKDEWKFFELAMNKLVPGGVKSVHEGYPDLGASDMSTHITEINNKKPDVTFSSLWGGDVATLMNQAAANNMFSNTKLVGTVLYSAVDELSKDVVTQADAFSGSRNWYWNFPKRSRWGPNKSTFQAARDNWDITPTAHFMSGYGAVTAWATAVDKLVTILGGWPSQKQIASALEGHGFNTPAGYHVMGEDHQGRSNAYSGRMAWSDEIGAAVLEDVNVFTPQEVSPPPGTKAEEWVKNW